QNKARGSEAFKRGDFTKALGYYDTALQSLPAEHPSRISILSNRALANLQTGSPKLAFADCEEALAIIGSGAGQDETIQEGSIAINMSSLWAKVMQRKATALEMQERHTDALVVWQTLVRSGQGGAAAMQAKQRCEKLCAPKSKPVAKVPVKVAVHAAPSGEGVAKLRAEAAAQDASELERQGLLDVVGDKIAAWSKGKEGNLRALLASLDLVLWPAANWKKVSLADLVLDGKVKVIYMKALAKVHPDKIPRDASVEQKMIAGAVFAKLNGAWDAFK
ncbi:DnaJ domain-containing protein, partial [Protomyces lactucae-debilis]